MVAERTAFSPPGISKPTKAEEAKFGKAEAIAVMYGWLPSVVLVSYYIPASGLN